MSTIVRSDGTPFIMQAYRELLSAKKKSQILQEVRFLAARQGQCVRLFQKDHGQYEAVFSTKPGYLLGESVWHYFNRPENLIYCEAVPDSAYILVVVVRSSLVYIDLQILGSSLQEKLLPLMTGNLRYRIVTAGNVPLRKAESFGTFRFPKELIESFDTLSAPLFPNLPALKALQLQPLPLLLKSERRSGFFKTSVFIALVLVLMVGGWWVLTPVSSKRVAISSPAPDRQLLEMVDRISELYFLPGWQAAKITFDGKIYAVDLIPEGGDMRSLHTWAHPRGYQFHLSPRGAELIFRSDLSARSKPKKTRSLEPVVTQLMDQLNPLLGHQAVHLGATYSRGTLKETQLSLHINSASPALLSWVSRLLNGLPVKVTSMTLKVDSGLITGTIQLSIWGK